MLGIKIVKACGMIWDGWYHILPIPHKDRSPILTRTLLCLVFGFLVLGHCLIQGVHAAPHPHAGMGCDDDCWVQKPTWHPVATLQSVPVMALPLCPLPGIVPVISPLRAHDAYRSALPPRAPPISALH